MKQSVDPKRAKARKRRGRKARQRRMRRIAAVIFALAAVVMLLLARGASPSLAALLWGASAALMVVLAVLLALRKGLPAPLYMLLGVMSLALAVAGPIGKSYVRSEGRYVPREILVEELKLTDRYPGNLPRMTNLKRLDMRDSTVTDFQPLARLTALESLDLRGNHAFTQADYDDLHAALPGCDILWSMPVGDGYVDSDARDIDLTGAAMSASEIESVMAAHPDAAISYTVSLMGNQYPADAQALDLQGKEVDAAAIDEALGLLTQVQTVDLRGVPASAQTIAALTEAHPEVRFMFTCDVPSGAMTTEDETVTIPGGTAQDVLACMAFIPYMPNLQTMDARAVTLTDQDVQAIQADPNCRKLIYSFTAFGRTLSTLDTELNLDNTQLNGVDEVERVVNCMPNLQRVSMCNCGLTDDQMGGLFDRHPDVRFIWYIHFGKYTLRTDATAFTTNLYAVNDYHYTSATFAPLRFCTDLMYLDIGHCELTSIEGLAGLKKLRVLILADNNITDISPLAGLEDLEYVEVFLNKIADLSPLANKTKLLDLNIYYNPTIKDLSPLATCTSLQRLWLGQCGLPDGQISAIRKALPNCKVYGNSSGSTEGGWRKHKRYEVIKAMNKSGQYIPFS